MSQFQLHVGDMKQCVRRNFACAAYGVADNCIGPYATQKMFGGHSPITIGGLLMPESGERFKIHAA